AVRISPTCGVPVGDGQNRTRTSLPVAVEKGAPDAVAEIADIAPILRRAVGCGLVASAHSLPLPSSTAREFTTISHMLTFLLRRPFSSVTINSWRHSNLCSPHHLMR